MLDVGKFRSPDDFPIFAVMKGLMEFYCTCAGVSFQVYWAKVGTSTSLPCTRLICLPSKNPFKLVEKVIDLHMFGTFNCVTVTSILQV